MTFNSRPRRAAFAGLLSTAAVGSLVGLYLGGTIDTAAAQDAGAGPAIRINSTLPTDLPRNATLTDAAVFAWQEFIALNWPAANQTGVPGSNTRGEPDASKKFGADEPGQPVVWETYRGKVETFPGVGDPPGYVNDKSKSYGFDVGPRYVYGTRSTNGSAQNNPGGPPLIVPPCQPSPKQIVTRPSYINLDEITQIGLDFMFAGVLPSSIPNPTAQNANAQPQLIRFLAKGNRTFYEYVAANRYWYKNAAFNQAVLNFKNAAASNVYPPPAPTMRLPAGTVLVKAAWRPLAQGENAENVHVKTVRFYDQSGTGNTACYREQKWVLLALHIIQKTPSQPDFIFATFEYTNNILTAGGASVEDQNGALKNAPAGDAMDPRLNYFDVNSTYYSPDYPKGIAVPPKPPVPIPPPPSPPSNVTLPLVQTGSPFCQSAGNKRLYFQDLDLSGGPIPPANSGVCVNKRYFATPSQIQKVNAAAHAALKSYGAPALWQNYRLVNVQSEPFDISEIDTTGTNERRLASTFSLANSVVETDNTLQQFFGGLFGATPENGFFKSAFENFSTGSGTAYNIYRPPSGSVPRNQFTRTNMGGCMGCHGRAQRAGTDFSFTLGGGPVDQPEFAVPATPPTAGAKPDLRAGFDERRLKVLQEALGGR